MFKKLKTSIELVKVSFTFIKRDWELLTYSVLSLLASLAILISFFGWWYFFIWDLETLKQQPDILIYFYVFLYYLIFSFITFFFNTAIITSVQRRIEGKDNNFWDGMRDASKHLKEILIWSTINALFSTILKILQNKFWEKSIIGKIILWLIGWMWNILTFFSFPLMILNWMWPKEAIKESGNLFKKTWWERAIIHVGVWLLFFLISFLMIWLWMFIMVSWMIITWIIFIVLSIILLVILSNTCDVIIKTILLHYAKTWILPNWLEDNIIIINYAREK